MVFCFAVGKVTGPRSPHTKNIITTNNLLDTENWLRIPKLCLVLVEVSVEIREAASCRTEHAENCQTQISSDEARALYSSALLESLTPKPHDVLCRGKGPRIRLFS